MRKVRANKQSRGFLQPSIDSTVDTYTEKRRQYAERKVVDSHDFVKAWVTSDNLDDVCERLEMTKTQASSKATSLRKRGVKLPRLSRRPDKNSVHELNKLVERYAK